MTPSYSSPGVGTEVSPYATSPLSQPRHRNRATFVQRWKVLRERNKNLPKLDFNAKANGLPKKFQAASSFSRSYTYDSMKLPSISTCSVVTGRSGKSVQSDGYRRKDKTSLQEQSVVSGSLTDLSTTKDFQEISANLSKSLQSLDDRNSSLEKGNNSHRYERISYQKHLSNRRKSNKGLEKEATVLYKEKTMVGTQNTQSKKQTVSKDHPDRQYVYVKNDKKERQKFPNILHTLQDKENQKKDGKSYHGYYTLQPYPIDTKPNLDSTSVTETLTMTPDDVTLKSPSSTRLCSPKPPVITQSPAHTINIALYDADLIAC